MAEHDAAGKELPPNIKETLRQRFKLYNLDKIEQGLPDISFEQFMKNEGFNPADII